MQRTAATVDFPLLIGSRSGWQAAARLLAVIILFGLPWPRITAGQGVVAAPNFGHSVGYVRDRRQADALTAVRRLATQGQAADFVTAVQWVLDQPKDSLIVQPDETLISVRTAVEAILASAPKERIDDYRRIVGATANGDLLQARSHRDRGGYWRIVRRFFYTEAGGRAAMELAAGWLDEGAHELAASLALRVIREPLHGAIVTPAFLRRTELALLRSGRVDEAAEVRQRMHDAFPAPSAKADRLDVSPPGDPVLESRWVMARPTWSAPLDSTLRFPQLTTPLRNWGNQQREQDLTTAFSARPVFARGQVVYRDLDRVRSVDARTGALLWEYQADLGLETLLAIGNAAGSRLSLPFLTETVATNALQAGVAADGRRAYVIDGAGGVTDALLNLVDLRDQTPQERRAQLRSHLTALDLDPVVSPARRQVWSTEDGAGRPLDGHVFLGAPLVTPGLLFAMTECDREICATAIDAATGEVRWLQPVAEADRSLVEDRPRGMRACTPVLANGMVLCPTQLGLLVALDAVNGAFRWVHNHLDMPANRTSTIRMVVALPQVRPAAYSPRPVAYEGRTFFLAGQSHALYCVDLTSGRTVWRTVVDDADYLAHVDGTAAVVIGRSTARAYSLNEGKEVWLSRLPSMPNGVGAALGDTYLLPIPGEGLLPLALSTGRLEMPMYRHVEGPMGHLVASSNGVVALGIEGLAEYRFTTSVRQELASLPAEQQVEPAAQFQLAELLLAEGNVIGATDRLEGLRQRSNRDWAVKAEDVLRSAYIALLKQEPAQAERWFQRLEPLCSAAEARSRWLVERGRWLLKQGDADRLMRIVTELSQHPGRGLYPVDEDAGLAVSSLCWLRRTVNPPTGMIARDDVVALLADLTAKDPHAETARTMEAVFPERAVVESVRFNLADAAKRRGEWHAAECWWTRNAASASSTTAAMAIRALAELYEDAGRAAMAAEMWTRLSTSYADVDTGGGETGQHYVQQRDPRSLAARAYRRRQPYVRSIGGIRFQVEEPSLHIGDPVEQAGVETLADPRFQPDRFVRWRLLRGDDADFEWTQRTIANDTWLLAWDRFSQKPLLKVRFADTALELPPAIGAALDVDQALPVGLPAEMRLISLLQGSSQGEAWRQALPEWEGRSGKPLCGPVTSRYALFQLRSTLVVVDSADGRVLWRRNDLDPQSGLNADRAAGIIADGELIGVLSSNKQSYRLFDAATGAVRATSRWEAAGTRFYKPAVVFGSRLAWAGESEDGKRVRVWDAATNERLLDESLRDRQFFELTSDRELAWLSANDELCVYNVSEGRFKVRCPMDSADLASLARMQVFQQGGRYYLNLGRQVQTVRTEHFHQSPSSQVLRFIPLGDDLVAITPSGAEIAWKQVLPKCGMIAFGKLPVPVLLTVSQIRDKADNNRIWTRIDGYDPATGLSLGSQQHLPRDEWLYADYDAERGRLSLIGSEKTIHIDFVDSNPTPPATNSPL